MVKLRIKIEQQLCIQEKAKIDLKHIFELLE